MPTIISLGSLTDYNSVIANQNDFCLSGSPLRDFVFRGQANSDWPLQTTFSRLLKRAGYMGKLREPASYNRSSHLRNFRQILLGRRGANPAALDDENAWALGQHYGLATPLLDWTTSPYIALFFAFAESESEGPMRTVWCLNKRITTTFDKEELKARILTLGQYRKYSERFYNGSYRDRKRVSLVLDAVIRGGHVKFFVPEADENSRIIAQSGVLSMLWDEREISEWADTLHPGSLIKINMPNTSEFREIVLSQLDLMNINFATLFPDIGGACLHANYAAESQFRR